MKIQIDEYDVFCHIDNTGEVMSLYGVTEHTEDGKIYLLGDAIAEFHKEHCELIQARVGQEISRRLNEQWEQCKSQEPIQNFDDNGPRHYVSEGEK